MILTCPACDTKYVVKDDAIPSAGRQVRCASCKHSWHQDPEMAVAEPAMAEELGGPPTPATVEPPLAGAWPPSQGEGGIAAEPQPEPEDEGHSPWGPVNEEPPPLAEPDEVAMEEAPAIADEWRPPAPFEEVAPESVEPAEEEFVGYAPIDEDDEGPKRRWPLVLLILVLIVAAAAAFWFFAPPEWKQRAGIAQVGASPVQVMITSKDRTMLASGNELISISGRIINPTDRELTVPPIQAELRNPQTNAVVRRWTINPPTPALPPHGSASFNSAQLDTPREGDHELFLTW